MRLWKVRMTRKDGYATKHVLIEAKTAQVAGRKAQRQNRGFEVNRIMWSVKLITAT